MYRSAAALLCGTTPWLSYSGKQLVEQLGERLSTPCTVDDIVCDFEWANRFELRRHLEREGLPTFDELRGWLQVVGWVRAFEVARRTLSAIAKDAGRQPSALYRRVKQVTGLTWKRLTIKGLHWVLTAFLERCRIPTWYVARDRQHIPAATSGEVAGIPTVMPQRFRAPQGQEHWMEGDQVAALVG